MVFYVSNHHTRPININNQIDPQGYAYNIYNVVQTIVSLVSELYFQATYDRYYECDIVGILFFVITIQSTTKVVRIGKGYNYHQI